MILVFVNVEDEMVNMFFVILMMFFLSLFVCVMVLVVYVMNLEEKKRKSDEGNGILDKEEV
jgi:heme/copper-type cytochrome/quinol oxidase subunit 2